MALCECSLRSPASSASESLRRTCLSLGISSTPSTSPTRSHGLMTARASLSQDSLTSKAMNPSATKSSLPTSASTSTLIMVKSYRPSSSTPKTPFTSRPRMAHQLLICTAPTSRTGILLHSSSKSQIRLAVTFTDPFPRVRLPLSAEVSTEASASVSSCPARPFSALVSAKTPWSSSAPPTRTHTRCGLSIALTSLTEWPASTVTCLTFRVLVKTHLRLSLGSTPPTPGSSWMMLPMVTSKDPTSTSSPRRVLSSSSSSAAPLRPRTTPPTGTSA